MIEASIYFPTNYWFWGIIAFLIGSFIGIRNMVKNGCSLPSAIFVVTIGMYTGLIGGRILYVLLFYPDKIFDITFTLPFWQGTGTYLGTPLAGLIGFFIGLRIVGKPLWSNAGSFVPGLAIAHAISRISCLVTTCCFGAPTSVPWAVYSKELKIMTHPTQIYSMIGEFISFLILQKLWKKPGLRSYLFPLYGIFLASHRFISEFFRGSEIGPEFIPGLRVYQTVCVFILIISISIIAILKFRKQGIVISSILIIFTIYISIPARSVTESKPHIIHNNSRLFLVVTRSIFADKLDTWKTERMKEGYDVVIMEYKNPPTSKEILNSIKNQIRINRKLCSYILIVGDCASDNKAVQWHIPSIKQKITNDNNPIEFITDSLYGDLDNDGTPDVPVGRIPVQNGEQLQTQIVKILNYKKIGYESSWLKSIIWFGAKGYSKEIHDIASSLIPRLPEWMNNVILSEKSNSSYSNNLQEQSGLFLDHMSKPAFLSIVASHGSPKSINLAKNNKDKINLCVNDLNRLQSKNPTGVLFLLGCSMGKFNMPTLKGQSLAEAFSNHPGGPIGIVAASAPTDPITNYIIITSIIDQLHSGLDTIGNIIFNIQQKLIVADKGNISQLAQKDPFVKSLLQSMPEKGRNIIKSPDLLSHEVLMYNLIGDPSCKFKLPDF